MLLAYTLGSVDFIEPEADVAKRQAGLVVGRSVGVAKSDGEPDVATLDYPVKTGASGIAEGMTHDTAGERLWFKRIATEAQAIVRVGQQALEHAEIHHIDGADSQAVGMKDSRH